MVLVSGATGNRGVMGVEELLWVVAIAFAVVNGVNDGAAILAVGLGVRTLRPLTGILLLAVAVGVAPIAVGTGVATTLAGRLVALDGPSGRVALLMAVAAAVIVTFGLSSRGLPTSLTLAVVGAIAGVGVGGGLPVSWGLVGIVLLVAAVAPALGLAVGWGLARLLSVLRTSTPLRRRIGRWHVVGFLLQALAYGANDGQKMLAVVAIAAGTASGGVSVSPALLVTVAAAFLVGTVLGLPRISATLSTGVVPVRPAGAVVTELSAASVVLGTGALGMPVSMTQSISGSLLGTGVTRGHGRVRWRQVAAIGVAWVVTLPLAFVLAALAAAAALAAT